MDRVEEPTIVKLTELSHGAGCGCKIAPSVLEEILKGKTSNAVFPELLVGNESRDDAAVLELPDGNCLISTTDFFTPIVDDAFDFGKISGANAISDVYAMGGKPILAIAILGWPVNKLSTTLAGKVIEGARAICDEAGIPLAGGHSIDTPEPIFGLSVNGLVKKEFLKKNNTAQQGDLIYLTKPLGTGILSTAMKRNKISEIDLSNAIAVMSRLNKTGELLGSLPYVHALTDVTGFGLLGHLIEMASGSGLSATIQYNDVPLIDGIKKYIDQMIFPDSIYRNWNSYQQQVTGINGPSFITLCDPQTSGGLLISVGKNNKKDFEKVMAEAGFDFLKPIGFFTGKTSKTIEVIE
jgi:selenide,water dikinase